MTVQSAAPRGFFASLFHTTDPGADSITVGGYALLAALIVLTALDVLVLRHEFSALGFAGAGAAILGAIGGGKKLRDGSGGDAGA